MKVKKRMATNVKKWMTMVMNTVSDEEKCMEANDDSIDAPSSNEFGEEILIALLQPKHLKSCSHQIQLLTF